MSLYFRKHKERYYPKFTEEIEDEDGNKIEVSTSRTKQAFKDQCDINKILKKSQIRGSISHLLKYPEPVYGEFDGEFGLLEATEKIAKANEIFNDLPSEIRNEFNNDALAFVKFAGDPLNNDKLRDLLPAIAEPGSYFPNPVERGGVGAAAATAPAEAASEAPPVVADPVPQGDQPVD